LVFDLPWIDRRRCGGPHYKVPVLKDIVLHVVMLSVYNMAGAKFSALKIVYVLIKKEQAGGSLPS